MTDQNQPKGNERLSLRNLGQRKREVHPRENNLRSTPAARRYAREKGIDLSKLDGFFGNRRITEKDIDLYLEKKRIVQKRVHKDQAHEVRESLPAEPAAEEDEGISPLARKLAEKLHVDYHKIESGSGPEGRILRRDIREAAQKAAAEDSVEPESDAADASESLKASAESEALPKESIDETAMADGPAAKADSADEAGTGAPNGVEMPDATAESDKASAAASDLVRNRDRRRLAAKVSADELVSADFNPEMAPDYTKIINLGVAAKADPDSERDFDIVVLGGGAAGIAAAIAAGRKGFKTALVAENFGGGFLYGGAVEARFLYENAKLIRSCIGARRNKGIVVDKLSLDMQVMGSEKQRAVDYEAAVLRSDLMDAGVRVFEGAGRPLAPGFIDVKDEGGRQERLNWRKLIVATGTLPQPAAFMEDYDEVITDRTIFNLDQIPQELTIIGDGPIVCEVASIYATMGSRVSIITAADNVLKGLDAQIINRLEEQMKRSGIGVHTRVKPVDVYKDSLGAIHIELADTDAKPAANGRYPKITTVISSAIYVASEYRVNTRGLDALRLDIDEGRIVIDEFGRTSVANVYAIGEATGRCTLAHQGRAMAQMVVDNIALEAEGSELRAIDFTQVPVCIHAFPEVATIGLDTRRAGVAHEDVRFGLAPLGSEPGSLFDEDKQGFVKVIVDGETREILGVHIIGEEACGLLGQVQALMAMRGTDADMARIVNPAPSLAQAVQNAFDKIDA